MISITTAALVHLTWQKGQDIRDDFNPVPTGCFKSGMLAGCVVCLLPNDEVGKGTS